MDYSPPLSMSSRRASIDSIEDLDAYFANYVPLSNLPTPPSIPSEPLDLDVSCATTSSSDHLHPLDPELAGPATLLANLVPSNACPHRPSATTIYDFLLRAQLPIEIIGLAACILDALSARFAGSWRQELALQVIESRNKDNGRSTPLMVRPGSSTSSCEPEVIILSALHVAVSYLSDKPRLPAFWSQQVALDAVSIAEINVTTRCILQDSDYGLHGFTPEMVEEAIMDVQRAVETIRTSSEPASMNSRETSFSTLSFQGLGSAVLVNGLLTPEPSPPC